MFRTVLVANRGEIARRIIRTLKGLGVTSVAVYSDADRHAPHVREADKAVRLGPPPVGDSYLNVETVIAACKESGAEAVHPGYGFLSENVTFAKRLAEEGIRFIGPRPEHLKRFGLKHEARDTAKTAGVPLLPGTDLVADLESAKTAAGEIGYPVMLKSTAGGGGIGLRLCQSEEDLNAEFEVVRRLGAGNFGNDGVFLEKFVQTARHLEVQIFGDGKGSVIALGERDCSLQRRNQKIVEEAPAPNLPETVRKSLQEAALALGRAVSYESAGTIEFIYDAENEAFYFLEVNTRLQVEHGVTEEIFGIDLVAWMIKQAAGDMPPLETLKLKQRGVAMEVRINAEDPVRDYRPSTGTLTNVTFPEDVRLDGWIETGSQITAYYDNLLAKLIVTAPTRERACAAMKKALKSSRIDGLETNLDYLGQIMAAPWFAKGEFATKTLASFPVRGRILEVLAPGAQTTVQDWPGRVGYWDVGVPPSGPMDSLSFRLTNRLLGNPEGAPGLECTVTGPTLKFHCDAIIALGGAPMSAHLDGKPVPLWKAVTVSKGQTLTLDTIEGPGNRTYLAVRGGLDVSRYLGSGSAFTLGGFGGHATGMLAAGDALRIKMEPPNSPCGNTLPQGLAPDLSHEWEIGVLYGPHGAPDFFTEDDIKVLFETAYEVHFNSARTGVRLIGPKPQWARSDGGEAGLHPSNIHDNAYAIGAIDFTGDMPIILGPDGPSLGGFVCPATIVQAELWKMGQLKAGDKVRFKALSESEAKTLRITQDTALISFAAPKTVNLAPPAPPTGAILGEGISNGTRVVYRRAGDNYMLVEFGPLQLDLTLRFQAHTLMQWLQNNRIRGIIDLTPGIRSLQIHYDGAELSNVRLLDILQTAEHELPGVDDIVVPSRTVYLPLSWDDESTQEAIRKYQNLVRPDAPWCPSNIEFIQRINGLNDEQAVKDIVFNADYMVLGLGDVYLGAPVATPVDPRHRLVTTKYNPARTWTPENAVGIGGAYMCIYGMEGPGGYQFVGRTVQMWNKWRNAGAFKEDKPWLLRFFDRVKFFPVEAKELTEAREGFPHGAYPIRIEDDTFNLADYRAFLAENQESTTAFQDRRQTAFDEERQRWEDLGLATIAQEDPALIAVEAEVSMPPNGFTADVNIPGSLWMLLVDPGDHVEAGQDIAVLETMKLEFTITSPQAGQVHEILVQPGQAVRKGQPLMILTRE